MSFRKISILVTAGALMGVPASLASGSSLPKLPSQIGRPSKGDLEIRPANIVYTGDGSGFFAGAPKANHRAKPLNWSGWTATGGQGSGFNWLNNCTPNCAGGTFHRFAVKLDAYRPRRLGGHLIFTRMKVTYTGKMPKRNSRTQVWKVVHQSGGYFYSFPSGG
jgi:hypothetical protein